MKSIFWIIWNEIKKKQKKLWIISFRSNLKFIYPIIFNNNDNIKINNIFLIEYVLLQKILIIFNIEYVKIYKINRN